MIKINRPPKPEFMLVAGNKWDEETRQAILYYGDPNNKNEFDFSAYNDTLLKDELRKIFVKCAYCESSYAGVSDGDIEHFRPKGRVNEKEPQSPGYYWLANDWDNLLLSCQHCNQRRRHLLQGGIALETAGKLDQFPLMNNFKHVCSHDQSLDTEEAGRLLINPCIDRDDPEEHFDYEEQNAVIIGLTERGKKSIEVYALLRQYLVEERNKKKDFLFKQISIVKRELTRFDLEKTEEQKRNFKEQLDNLFFFGKPDQPYSGMCRFFIRKFLKENNIGP